MCDSWWFYRLLTGIASPLMHLHYRRRTLNRKELTHRLPERWGNPALSTPPQKRPEGKLIWFHAASVGEMNSILPLIQELLARDESLNILLTTMTVTSAELAQHKLPPRAIHQFLPVDIKAPVQRFLRYWKPDAAFLTESEIWPTLIIELKKSVPVYGIVNGRMSEKSLKKWSYLPKGIAALLRGFTIFAQSIKDAERYRKLGGTNVSFIGNLKLDAPPLAYDETEYQSLKAKIGKRPVWLAASIHPEEESIVINVATELRKQFPELLTIIVPRHPDRGVPLAEACRSSVLRSVGEDDLLKDTTHYYIADTMGELGLFYRLSKIVFMGGSLFDHGGQNMLEPARLGCACLWGEHVFNFEDVAGMLARYQAGIAVKNDGDDLLNQLADLLSHPEKAKEIGSRAQRLMEGQSGVVANVANAINAMQPASAAL